MPLSEPESEEAELTDIPGGGGAPGLFGLPPSFWQVIRFAVVGGSGVVAFIVVSTIAIDLRTGVPDWVMSALCYAAMILPVYLGHRAFSFRSNIPHMQAFPRYVLTQIFAVLLAAVISYGAYAIPGLPTIVAATLVSGLTSVFTFVVLKLWAFAARR